MKRTTFFAILFLLWTASPAPAKAPYEVPPPDAIDPFVGNSVLGLNLDVFGSALGGGAMEYPPGTLQGHLESYWLRYNGNKEYHGTWPFFDSTSSLVAEILPMDYTVYDAGSRLQAFGKSRAGQIDIEMTALSLEGHNWVRVVYKLVNSGAAAATNVRFFQFADIDIGPEGVGGLPPENADDTAKYVDALNTVYVTDDSGITMGVMSPVKPQHHDVWGGPIPSFPYPYANPGYLNLQNDTLNNQNEFTGDAAMTMEWDFPALNPGESVEIPVYFFGALDENDVPDLFDEVDTLPTDIPTLGEWGLILMASFLAVAGGLAVSRRKQVFHHLNP